MRIRRTLAGLAIVGLAAGCAPTQSAPAAGGDEKTGTLRVWLFDEANRTPKEATVKEAIAEFKAAHAGVEVDVQWIPVEGRADKFSGAFNDPSNAPDVAEYGNTDAASYVETGGPATGGFTYADDRETGEFGFEDIINPASATSVPNGQLDGQHVDALGQTRFSEDVNARDDQPKGCRLPDNPPCTNTYTPVLETYGGQGRTLPGLMIDVSAAANRTPQGNEYRLFSNSARPIDRNVARVNRAFFFRRALKLVNGIAKLPKGDTNQSAAAKAAAAEGGEKFKRHGDYAIALFLSYYSFFREAGEIDYLELPAKGSRWDDPGGRRGRDDPLRDFDFERKSGV